MRGGNQALGTGLSSSLLLDPLWLLPQTGATELRGPGGSRTVPAPVTFRGPQEGAQLGQRELKLSQNKASSQAVMGDQGGQAELARP